jgi:fatty-acyl-CoA synthase
MVLRAPWLTEGYFKDATKGRRTLGGRLAAHRRRGDPGQHGRDRHSDRIKDVIKTGGEWISSLDLEDLISRHVAVREVAVVGIADPQWGERPFALLVTS